MMWQEQKCFLKGMQATDASYGHSRQAWEQSSEEVEIVMRHS